MEILIQITSRDIEYKYYDMTWFHIVPSQFNGITSVSHDQTKLSNTRTILARAHNRLKGRI